MGPAERGAGTQSTDEPHSSAMSHTCSPPGMDSSSWTALPRRAMRHVVGNLGLTPRYILSSNFVGCVVNTSSRGAVTAKTTESPYSEIRMRIRLNY